MQFLMICRRRIESFPAEEFDKYLDDEAEELRRLYAEGFVRNAWSRNDVLGAVLQIEADTMEQVEQQVRRLPLVARDMMDLQVIPLKGYRGFGPRYSAK
jgi:hypothetical protein